MNSDSVGRLNRLADTYESILRDVRVSEFNAPVNRKEEQIIFMKHIGNGSTYNPQFSYRTPPEQFEKPLESFLDALDPDADAWERMLFEDARFRLDGFLGLAAHDPELITARSISSKGDVSVDLINASREYLQTVETLSEDAEPENIQASEAVNIFSDSLKRIGISDWRVEIRSPLNARTSVRSAEKLIQVREGARYSQSAIKRLLIHEIGTHVFRYLNGSQQPLNMLRLGLLGYLETEEGLAAYNERKFGVADSNSTRRYAVRVLAADLALRHSFCEVYAEIRPYTTAEDAFTATVNVKRGFTDTSVPGADVKDKVYFEGLLRITALLTRSPQHYETLMSAKISIEMLDAVEELKESSLFVLGSYFPELISAIAEAGDLS